MMCPDRSHFLHPFTDEKALSQKDARVITRGKGIYIWDAKGRKLLDAMSGVACVNVGYGRQELIDAARTQLEELSFYSNFSGSSVVPAVNLADLLCEVTPPAINHFFFTNSGSEATDTVLRMVRRYWELAGQPQKKIIISCQNSIHGSTVFAAALGGTEEVRQRRDLPVTHTELIGQPYYFCYGNALAPELFGIRAALWLEQQILKSGPDKVAAFIGEPVQGGGGFIVPPASYWPEIQRICEKYDVLLVSDEVVCGFGRLGTWFGCGHFGFRPDLITFGKGVTSGYIPLGGVGVSDRVAESLIDRGGVFDHGFSCSGHPVACAVAIANIRLMQRDGLIRRVAEESGPFLRKRFLELKDHPLVGAIETCGMTAALVLVKNAQSGQLFDVDSKVGKLCRDICFDEGIVVQAAGSRMMIAPPLVISFAEIDEMIGLIKNGLDRTYHDLQKRNML